MGETMLFAPKVKKDAIDLAEVKDTANKSALLLLGSALAFSFLRGPEICGIGYFGIFTGFYALGSLIESREEIKNWKSVVK